MGSFIRNVKKPESTTDTPTSNGLETKAAIMGKARSRQDWTADRNWGVKRRTVATRRRTPRGVNGVADVLYGWWWLSGVKDTAIRDGIGDGGLTACGLCATGHARRRLPAEVMRNSFQTPTQVRYSGFQRTNLALESGQMSMPNCQWMEWYHRRPTINSKQSTVRSQAPLRDANSTQSTLAFTPLPQPNHAQ